MDFTYYAKYREKTTGFQYKSLDMTDGSVKDTELSGAQMKLFSSHYGPMLCAMLYVDVSGRLSMYIGGLGRAVYGLKGESPWADEAEGRILNLFAAESEYGDRMTLFSIYNAFISDPFTYGRALLKTVKPSEDNTDYYVDVEALGEALRLAREASPTLKIASGFRSNTLLSYYTYNPFTAADGIDAFRLHLFSCGISNVEARFISGKCSEESLNELVKLLEGASGGIAYVFKATFEKIKLKLSNG